MSQTSVDTLETLEDVQEFLDSSLNPTLLLDRRGQVHLANPALEQLMERPNEQILKKTFGDALSCIHTGDHPDGCMYGSICSDCFLHKAMKLGLKTRGLVEAEGVLAVGNPAGGVARPVLQTQVQPWFDKRRMYLVMSVSGVDHLA